jgi:hypothetical protein
MINILHTYIAYNLHFDPYDPTILRIVVFFFFGHNFPWPNYFWGLRNEMLSNFNYSYVRIPIGNTMKEEMKGKYN